MCDSAATVIQALARGYLGRGASPWDHLPSIVYASWGEFWEPLDQDDATMWLIRADNDVDGLPVYKGLCEGQHIAALQFVPSTPTAWYLTWLVDGTPYSFWWPTRGLCLPAPFFSSQMSCPLGTMESSVSLQTWSGPTSLLERVIAAWDKLDGMEMAMETDTDICFTTTGGVCTGPPMVTRHRRPAALSAYIKDNFRYEGGRDAVAQVIVNKGKVHAVYLR
jgi:hypothetical protein